MVFEKRHVKTNFVISLGKDVQFLSISIENAHILASL